jgi:hypothetical protein
VTYDFEVSYITASPLGVPQQVCLSDLFLFLEYLLSVKFFIWVGLMFMDDKWVGFRFLEVLIFSARSTTCACIFIF